jgi:hypothetical protein
MGFRPEPTVYKLTFEGTALDGLTVRASACSVAEYTEMIRITTTQQAPIDTSQLKTPEDIQRVSAEIQKRSEEVVRNNDRMLELFATHLVSWDLEDMAGRVVPPTRDGIDSQERPLINQLIQAWQVALVSIPNPSKPDSSDGKISEEQSLGLGNLSQSPGN